jgi:hypothetical protein
MRAATALFLVKLIHTGAWMFFAGCIVTLPFAAHSGHLDFAFVLVAFDVVEVVVDN